MTTRKGLVASAMAVLFACSIAPAGGAATLKIGDINSYTRLPAFTLPYKDGLDLAVEQTTASGVVCGQPL